MTYDPDDLYDESVFINGNVEKITDKAVLINLNTTTVRKSIFGGVMPHENKIWIPISQVTNMDELKEGYVEVDIGLTSWFANKEGIV